ncbi:MAG: DHA2 family efflux MFS transporter permease subunit [Rickettsiales bacterium]
MNAQVTEKAVNPWLVAFVVSLATFMEVLDTTITNVSLSHIAGSLSASQDESTWVLTSYLVANGIVLPISGWLAGVLGRRRYFILCILGFTVASFACGAATSLVELIIFRLIQGFAGGGLQPTQQAIVLDAFPPEKRGQVFGVTGITLIAAPIIGPTLGGLITDNFSWRWIFFINVPVGIFAAIMVSRFVKDPPHAVKQGFKSIDYIGLGLLALGLGALQLVLDKGQQKDWFDSTYIVSFFALSIFLIPFAIAWIMRQEDPIVDFTLLKDRGFGFGFILIFFTGFALYGSSALLPLMLQSQFGYDATLAGLVISPGGLAVIFLMPLSGKLVSKVEARYLIAVGLFLCGCGMWLTTSVTPQTDYQHFVWMRVFQVLGLPFLFIPVSTLAFMNVPKEKSSKASALFSLGRNLGGSVGIALVTTYVARHSQMHQYVLSEHLTPGDPVYENMRHSLIQTFINRGFDSLDAAHQATGHIYRELLRQASILSYNDAYFFLCCVMATGLLLTLFLPSNSPRAKPSAATAAH